MNIFRKVALQGLKGNRTRTAATVAGVALSSAMVTAIITFAVSLQTYMMNGAMAKYGNWHVGFTDVSSSFLREREKDGGVMNTAYFENVGYARLTGGENPDKPYLFVAGFAGETFETLPVELISGRLPENDGEVLIPAHVASNGGVSFWTGDVISLELGLRMDGDGELSQHDPYISGEEPGTVQESFLPVAEKTYTVTGICERPGFEERTAPGYTLITLSDRAESAESLSVFVTLENPLRARSYGESAADGHDCYFNSSVLRFVGLSDSEVMNTILYAVVIILILLTMLGSVFLIWNSFAISLNDRMHQLGILMSVGATERQVRNSVLFEGLCIGAAGIPAGMLVGIPAIRLVLFAVSGNFGNIMYDNVPLKPVLSVPALIAAAAVSMITILISAGLPAKKAARVPVMECIRQTNEIRVEAKAVKTSKLAGLICGQEGNLALKNFRRNRRRYRSVVLSLCLSVVLWVSASSFGTDLNLLASSSIVDADGDILLYLDNVEEDEASRLYDELRTVSGVDESAMETMREGEKERVCMTFWSDAPARSVERMRQVIGMAGIRSGYDLYNVREVLEDNRNMLFVVNLFSAVFIGMISLIAVANVFNTISTNIRLRRRELAMLRSVGMSDGSFNRMMRFECVLYGLRTLLFGIPLAVLCSWGIYMGLVSVEEFEIGFPFPWKSIGISVLGVFAVIFVTMCYTTGKVRKENIIDALRDEMT